MPPEAGPTSYRLWGGAFTEPADPEMLAFTGSLAVDRRLALHDIAGSIAHARMLGRTGILSEADAARMIAALQGIAAELQAGRLELDPQAEDVHSAVEGLLVERIGDAGQKLHTARSRNDQVATDLRMWVRDALDQLDGAAAELQEALLAQAERHLETLMPGYTHLQPAQPVTLAHHLMAYVAMLFRDRERLHQARRRCNVLPLGAGALAGSTLPIDPQVVARELGFEDVAANSMDAVSDRDFAVEFVFACSLIMVHLSRLAEEVVLWATPAFGFVRLPDRLATGSSMMPQKKNPDVAELTRGRAGRVTGHLVQLLMLLKGLPLTYNRDLQEDKPSVFESFDTTRAALRMAARLVAAMEFNREAMARAVTGEMLATDLAEHLVRRGMPFREAHARVGTLLRQLAAQGRRLDQLSPADLSEGLGVAAGEAAAWLREPHKAVAARTLPAGPAPAMVREALARARETMRRMGQAPSPARTVI